jgi:DNA-binding NarL/FixJ family response regulator
MPCRRAEPSSLLPNVARDNRENVRVLVIDDDRRVRTAIRETIALEADMDVVGEASDLAAALALASCATPDVALVDVLLPDLRTGLELVRILSTTSGCSVLAMSVQSHLAAAGLAAGALGFVEKNADIDAVLNAIRRTARAPGG